jgi:P27 family predicted phage terminase small subunit
VPEPPGFLMPAAKAEWARLAPEAHALGLLTPLDVSLFVVYCQSVGRWLQAEDLLAKTVREAAANGDDGGGLAVAGSRGGAVINPLLKVAVACARDVCRYAGEFGFTPASRARLRAGFDPPPPPANLVTYWRDMPAPVEEGRSGPAVGPTAKRAAPR